MANVRFGWSISGLDALPCDVRFASAGSSVDAIAATGSDLPHVGVLLGFNGHAHPDRAEPKHVGVLRATHHDPNGDQHSLPIGGERVDGSLDALGAHQELF
jgi:hypothetical protein